MKMFITYNFLSSWDNQNLKTSLHLCRQDASTNVSGNLEKRMFRFDPKPGFRPYHIMFKFFDLPKIPGIEM